MRPIQRVKIKAQCHDKNGSNLGCCYSAAQKGQAGDLLGTTTTQDQATWFHGQTSSVDNIILVNPSSSFENWSRHNINTQSKKIPS